MPGKHNLLINKGHFSWLLLLAVLIPPMPGRAASAEIDGIWSGVMVSEGKQGTITLTIQRTEEGYTAEYRGFPHFSGSLLNVKCGPGKQPGTTTFSAVSKALQLSGRNEARLRFYLTKEPSKPQLYGLILLDGDSGKDRTYSVVLEQRPCCHAECVLRTDCP